MNAQDYYKHFTAAWHLLRDFVGKPNSEEFWNAYADALEDTAVREMAGSRFGMDLLHAVTKELERIKREETNQNGKNPPINNNKILQQ